MEIQDGSNDRRYFTIVPNYILNHSTMWDREVYIQMKRIAGEQGTCWTSRKTLAEQCGVSTRRLDKSIKYLIEHEWIKPIGTKRVGTAGGTQQVNEYKITDLWNLNNKYYQDKGIAPETTPSDKGVAQNDQRYSTDDAKGIAPGAHKEDHINKITIKEDISNINILIELFKEVNPSYKQLYRNTTERACLTRMVKEHGQERVAELINVLAQTNGMEFAPVITTPYKLEKKLGDLIVFINNKKNKPKSIKL